MVDGSDSDRRRRWLRWRFLYAATALLLIAGMLRAQAAMTADELAARVDRHYNSLHSLEVHFVQHYDGMGMHRTQSGVLLLKKPGRMRWTYTDPDGKLFILDGRDAFSYMPGESEAQRMSEKKLDDLQSPLRFLLGHTDLQKELTGLSMTPDGNGEYVLSGVPKGMEQRIAKLKITATASGTIRAMSIEETDGVTNSFDFSGELENAPAPASAFLFTPPPGVHVVEAMPPV